MKLSTSLAVLFLSAVFAAPAGATIMYAPEYYGPGDTVRSFTVAGDGGLTPVAGSPFAIGAPAPGSIGIGSIAIGPDGARGIVGYSFGGGRQGLSFGTGGDLAVTQPVFGSASGGIVAVSPDGQFAYQANTNGVKGVAAFSVGANGVLTELSGSPFYTAQGFYGMAIRPDGKTLYAAESNAIRPFTIASDGSLTAQPAAALPGANLIELSPDGSHLFATNNSNEMGSFAIAADGSLTPVGTPISVGSTFGGFFSVAPDGRHLYIVDYNGEALGGPPSVNSYAIAPDGSLTLAGATPTDPLRPRTVTVSPDGQYVYAGDSSASKVQVSPIGANGVLTGFREAADWHSGEPIPFVFKPENAPAASFKSRVTTKPLTMIFDGAASTSPDGSVDRFDWSFGDGATDSSATTPRSTHKFAKAGKYSVTLEASNAGCSTQTIYNGHSTVCVGSPAAAKTVTVDTPPWITSLKVSPSTVSRKTRIKFKLTEKAKVAFYAQKRTSGRMVGSSCRKKSKANAKMAKCERWVRASRTFTKSGKGLKTTSFKFTGKVRGKKIHRGKYRLYAIATDSAKGKSPSRTTSFRIR